MTTNIEKEKQRHEIISLIRKLGNVPYEIDAGLDSCNLTILFVLYDFFATLKNKEKNETW